METSPEPQESQELDEAPLEPQEPSKLLEQEVEMETPPEPQDSPKRQEPLEQRVEMETQPEPHHYSKRQEPQVPQDLEIWCLIVGMVGTAFPVAVKGTDRVWELQKTIKNEAVEIFGDFNAAQLRLFLAKKENGQWLSEMEVKDIENGDTEPAMPLLDRGHLASMSRLAAIFEDRDTDAVHILIPAPMKTSDIEVIADITGKRKRSNGDVETMEIAKEELAALFDVLGKSTQTGPNLITTSGLSEFWKGYGGFPSSYFIRREEVMLWGLVMRLLSKRKKRIVLTGSLGVGKSCFVALLSFYLAFVEKRKVLVVRRLKGFSEASSVVFLNGESCTCIRKTNLPAAKISSLFDRKEFQGSLILIDGYSEVEVGRRFGFFPYQLLATSADYEGNDSLFLVVLPSWRYGDLLHYAKSTIDEWKRSTGFDQKGQEAVIDLVDAQYFYSGGNLRDFCRNRDDVKDRIDEICGLTSKAQTIDLELEQYGHYVIDSDNEDHYFGVRNWVYPMDSGYAYKRIGRFMGMDTCLGHYELSQTLNAGFSGAAYEQCFHAAVNQSRKRAPVQMVNVVVNFDPSSSNQRYDRIELHDRAVECEGKTLDECFKHLSMLTPGTYWHPDCPTFPVIDAVVVCEAVLRGSNAKETIIALIATTVRDKKSFEHGVWKKLNKGLDANESIPNDIPRVLVVVGPDARTCKRFTLSNAPAPDDFMVCCYDPLNFLRRSLHARIA